MLVTCLLAKLISSVFITSSTPFGWVAAIGDNNCEVDYNIKVMSKFNSLVDV